MKRGLCPSLTLLACLKRLNLDLNMIWLVGNVLMKRRMRDNVTRLSIPFNGAYCHCGVPCKQHFTAYNTEYYACRRYHGCDYKQWGTRYRNPGGRKIYVKRLRQIKRIKR